MCLCELKLFVHAGNLKDVQMLIKDGVDINVRNRNGSTPFFYAVENGNKCSKFWNNERLSHLKGFLLLYLSVICIMNQIKRKLLEDFFFDWLNQRNLLEIIHLAHMDVAMVLFENGCDAQFGEKEWRIHAFRCFALNGNGNWIFNIKLIEKFLFEQMNRW